MLFAASVAASRTSELLGDMALKGKVELRNPKVRYADPVVKDATYRIPNAETIEAIRQVEDGEDLVDYNDMDEFMEEYAKYKSNESQDQ